MAEMNRSADLKISLGTLKDQGEELAEFLEPRVGTKPSVSGGSLEMDDGSIREGVRPRHVKTYIKRFMYTKGVKKNYRVFVSGKELTIQEIELGEEEKKKGEEEAPQAPTKEEGPKEKEEPAPEKAQEEPKQEKAAPKKPRTKKKKVESGD